MKTQNKYTYVEYPDGLILIRDETDKTPFGGFYYTLKEVTELLNEQDQKIKELQDEKATLIETCDKLATNTFETFDINLYTALVALSNETKDMNFLTKEDLYDFAELDEELNTGIVPNDTDIEAISPEYYEYTYNKWISAAIRRYTEMRKQFLKGGQ